MVKIKLIPFLLFLLLLLFSHNGFSQSDKPIYSGLTISVMPLSLIDYTPRFRVGVERLPVRKIGYGIDVGFGKSWLNGWRLSGGDWGNDYSFYEIRPELKYVVKRDDRYFLYCGTELFYLLMTDRLEDNCYQKGYSGNAISYDRARFQKQKYGIHLKAGVSHRLFEHFNVDIYGGAGVAERVIEYSEVVNPVEGDGDIFVEWLPQNHLFEGKTVLFHLTMGFRVGYIISCR